MIYGLPLWAVAVISTVLGVAIVGCVALLAYHFQTADPLAEHRTQPDGGSEEFAELVDDGEEPPDVPRDELGELEDEINLRPPTLRGSSFGFFGEVLKTRRYLKKSEKLAGKGYVKWYCVDDTFPEPKFIKPADEGTGKLEYEHDGGIYLFPRDAAKPSSTSGMWTYVHQKGDPEPLNVHDYREEVFTAEEIKEWLTQAVTADRPTDGLFDFLGDFDTQDAMPIAIGAVLVIAVLNSQGVF